MSTKSIFLPNEIAIFDNMSKPTEYLPFSILLKLAGSIPTRVARSRASMPLSSRICLILLPILVLSGYLFPELMPIRDIPFKIASLMMPLIISSLLSEKFLSKISSRT